MDEPVCRICNCHEVYTSKQPDHFILPCKCPGLCHRSCLEEDRKSNICEICNFEYKMEYKLPPYSAYLSSIHPYSTVFKNRRFYSFVIFNYISIMEAMYCLIKYIETVGNEKNSLLFETWFWYYSIAAWILVSPFILYVIYGFLCKPDKFKIWQHDNKIWFVADQLCPEKSLQYNSHRRKPHNTITFQEDQICRICSSSDNFKDLIKPCKCFGKIHRSCWQKSDHCEICQFKFKTEHKLKGFSDYLREKGYKGKRSNSNEKYQDKCNPYLDAIFVIIFLPIFIFASLASIWAVVQAEKDGDSNLDGDLFSYYQLKRIFYAIVSYLVMLLSNSAMLRVLWLNWKDFKSWQDEQEKILMVVDQKPLQSSSFWRTLTVFSSKHQIADISRSKQVTSSHAIVISEISVEEDSISIHGLINKNIIDV